MTTELIVFPPFYKRGNGNESWLLPKSCSAQLFTWPGVQGRESYALGLYTLVNISN